MQARHPTHPDEPASRAGLRVAPFGLDGCTALVTGARGGIGRASALALAEAGADPADIAGPVVFLSPAAADHVHGHVLVVDGGWMAR